MLDQKQIIAIANDYYQRYFPLPQDKEDILRRDNQDDPYAHYDDIMAAIVTAKAKYNARKRKKERNRKNILMKKQSIHAK